MKGRNRFTRRLLLGALGAAGLATFSLAGLPERPPEILPLVLLGVGGLALEWLAYPQPGLGFFSAAPACYLALALHPRVGPAWAGVAVCLGVAGRGLLRGSREPAARLRESLIDALPALCACAAVDLVGRTPWVESGRLAWSWVAPLVVELYVPLSLLLPEALASEMPAEDFDAWRRVREKTFWAWLSLGFVGTALALMMQPAPWQGLWLAPALVALQRFADKAVDEVRAEEHQALGRRLEASRRALERMARDKERVDKALSQSLEERALRAELACALAQSQDLEATAARLLELCAALLPHRTVALLLAQDDQLVPHSWRSPQGTRLESAALLALREPVAEEAWRTGQPRRREEEGDDPGRLFSGERSCLAAPVGKTGFPPVGGRMGGISGVLYVGHSRPEAYGEDALVLLSIVAEQAQAALEAASSLRRQGEILETERATRGHLERLVEQLDALLEAFGALASSLQDESLLESLSEQARRLTGAEQVAIFEHDLRGEGFDPGQARALAEAVRANGRPLLLGDASAGRFAGLGPTSVLAVPWERGVLMVGAAGKDAFDRSQADLLWLLAAQAGLALENARLHREALEAFARLQKSESQLIQSSKMAAVGSLAAGVAHELNTPLAVVQLSLQAALALAADPETTSFLERAQRAAGRTKTIVEKLLYYSREARVGRQRTDLNALVADTVELLAHPLKLDGVDLALDLSQEPVLVTCNQNEMQQVLTNLLLNARDAVLEGEWPRRVEVGTRGEDGTARLWVADQGPGIAPELHGRIFDPFFTTKPVGRGTGLGLSVSSRIVEGEAGTLSVESQPGRGARFEVRLPQ